MKGIMFKVWKAKAITEGSLDREWQTRRIITPQPLVSSLSGMTGGEFSVSGRDYFSRYEVGNVVYIKEVHYKYGYWLQTSGRGKEFQITSDEVKFLENPPAEILTSAYLRLGWYKRSPLFLFERDARTFIKITSVRPERLQEITPEDCMAEGITSDPYELHIVERIPSFWIGRYQELWDSINKQPYDWNSNPWCWKYSFKKAENK